MSLKELFPNVNPDDRVVFIGMDPRETTAYQVAKHSILRYAPNVKVFPLYAKSLRQEGLYSRTLTVEGTTGQFVDNRDGRPHSVEFSFTRFLVPFIAKQLGIKGNAIFIDCDFLLTGDINQLFDDTEGMEEPLAVVKHKFTPKGEVKMDGCSQLAYKFKLWTAMMVFNVNHPSLEILSPSYVSTASGRELHQFAWLPNPELNTLGVWEGYQFIPGHSDERVELPLVIHYTEKAPWFNGEFIEESPWGNLWWEAAEDYKKYLSTVPYKTRFWE